MQTATQTARRRDSGQLRLAQPWTVAADQGVYFRRGQLAMIAAAPGVGKSVLAMSYALQSKVRTLYLSMDTDSYTTSIRLIAATCDVTMQMAEAFRSNGVPPEVLRELGKADHAHFAFPSSPDEGEIAARLMAYRESQGEYPELVVIDNLTNIMFEDEEFSGLRRLMLELQGTAMKTGSAILVLHHVVGEHESGTRPIPLQGISGKLSKTPALIMTAYRPNSDHIALSVTKNRFGRADPSGQGVQFALTADLEKARIYDGSPTGTPFSEG